MKYKFYVGGIWQGTHQYSYNIDIINPSKSLLKVVFSENNFLLGFILNL